ncbi:MAG: sigma-54-dependent Fis family transcriptional regulator, partial [Acidobacteria bacterium CG_4_9_14_3_um_filter_49_7]
MSKKSFPAMILVVDDSAPTREIIGRNLVAAAYGVLTASNVQEAISLLKKERVDLIITDLKMPGPSGLELVRYAKENMP